MDKETFEHHILFVDDEPQAVEQLIRSIARRGAPFGCYHAATETDALAAQQRLNPPVAVVDLCLNLDVGPESGLSLIGRLLKADPSIRILVLTGHGTDHFGVQALHAGAASFLTKPASAEHLLALINDGINYAELKRGFQQIVETNSQPFGAYGISSACPAMIEVLREASFAASNAQSVLILGETGTGKGMLARAIHKKSARRRRNIVRFQPSFGSSDLVSSELFGHERGAFTGATDARKGLLEEANGGTLFIDEVADLPIQTQVMLLEVLQEMKFRRVGASRDQQVNLRLISATNKQLDKCIETGQLREDFLHRIRHLQINIIPLRERKQDILALSQLFLETLAVREDLSVHGLSDKALGILQSHDWPGNVRELQAVVENAVYRAAYAEKRQIGLAEIEIIDFNKPTTKQTTGSLREQVKAFEVQLVRQALELCDNNQSHAAELLRIDRSSFRRILQRS